MPVYLVERYIPGLTAEGVRAHAQREVEALACLDGIARHVRHLRTTYLREDELCFVLFEAPSLDALREANARMGMAYERITEADDVSAAGGG